MRTKSNNAISPEVDAILSRCVDNAERVRVAKRLEAIAAEIWERVFGERKADPQFPRFYRN
jgi:hypothetical protein